MAEVPRDSDDKYALGMPNRSQPVQFLFEFGSRCCAISRPAVARCAC